MRYLLLVMLSCLVAIASDTVAQDSRYYATIRTIGGKSLISGFLYRVGDSTVEIIPGRKRKDLKNIGTTEPLAVPIQVIRQVSVIKVKRSGIVALEIFGMGTVAGVGAGLVIIRHPKLYLPALLVADVAVLSAYSALRVRTFSPEDYFFREKLEDRCILKDERSIVLN